MRLVAVLICLAIAIAGSSATGPLPLPPHLRSHPAFTKDRWAHTGAAPADHPHTITLALKQRNLDKLHALFEAVSDPQSPTYAQYLSREELRDIVQPPRSAQRAIERWLQAHNASKIDFLVTRDAVRATVPIASVNRMFSVEMREFRHADGRTLYRSLQPHRVPSRIARHVQLVLGVSTFPVPSNRKRSLRETAPLSRRAHKPYAPLRPESIVGKPVLDEVAARVQFAVSFHPQCADGSVPKSLPLCQQAPPAPNALYIQAWPANDNSEAQPITTTLAFDSSACSVDSSVVSCRVTTSSSWLPLYTPMNVSVALFFGDGVGPSVVNPFPIVRTPPVTPQGLSKLYNIPANTLVTNASNTQCVVEFEQQYFTQSDLALFMSAMGLPAPAPVPVIGPNPGPAGGEANLDIQWIMGLAPGAPTTFWSIFSNSSVEIDDILQWEFAIGNATTPPLVNSVSYGMTSSAVDQFLGAGYLARSDVEFQKLSLRGITILIASGDTGAGDLGAPPMSAPNCTTLNPDWPSQSPYVLSVGSTLITPNALPICYLPAALGGIDCSNNPLGEATVSLEQGLFWTGGGGFSAETSQPGYQATAVNGYLTQARALGLLPPSSMWNSSNRGYPDVAAVGHNLMVALGGQFIPVDGTSASAPIFGGILTLLNDLRLNNNLPPLGFVNPLLYQIAKDTPAAFYDVTVGSNRCGAYGWSPLCCDSAFHALPGWDPTAGLGTPNFEVLREAVLKAPRWVNQRHSFRA